MLLDWQLTLVISGGLHSSIRVIHADNAICILMTHQDHRCHLVYVVTPCVWRSVTLVPVLNCRSSRSRGIVSCWKCGESLQLSHDALNDLNIFVMRYVYGDVRSSSIDLLRADKWRWQKNKSLMRLPPDDDCLKQHITRANFLAYIQRHPELRDHPSPVGYGWTLVNGRWL